MTKPSTAIEDCTALSLPCVPAYGPVAATSDIESITQNSHRPYALRQFIISSHITKSSLGNTVFIADLSPVASTTRPCDAKHKDSKVPTADEDAQHGVELMIIFRISLPAQQLDRVADGNASVRQ